MTIFIGWLLLSFFIAAIGANRNIGFWAALFVSLVFSPIVGLVVTLTSRDKADELNRKEFKDAVMKNISTTPSTPINQQSITEELGRLKTLLDTGAISQEEFQKLKNSLIAKFD